MARREQRASPRPCTKGGHNCGHGGFPKASASDADIVCHIATDNYLGGRIAARAMARSLRNTGLVAIVDHPEVESSRLRVQGFRNELRTSGNTISIVESRAALGTLDTGRTVAAQLLTEFPGLDGLFCINDPSALGALEAAVTANRQHDLSIVGFDGIGPVRTAIQEGRITASLAQDPVAIGRLTATAIVRHFAGQDLPHQILIPPTLIQRETVE